MILSRLLAVCLLLFSFSVAPSAAQPPAETPEGSETLRQAKPDFTWEQTDTCLALLNHGRVVWQHVHDRKIGKPYMRIGLLDGTELTRPCPFPKDYPKRDHTWHRALWWAWKAINGVNFWEQNQTGTEPVKVTSEQSDDGAARIDLTIAYHQPDQPPVVTEHRVITVGKPDATGSYHIDWQASFTPAGEADVVFNKNSYGGMAIRLAAECCGDEAAGRSAWEFFDSEGHANSNGQRARWVAYGGTTPDGQAAAVVMFDHPENPRHPSWWQTRSHYPYLNPSFTCKEHYTLAAGESLTLRYRILVHQGPADKETMQQQWKAFADTPKVE
jgi:hypothetical protein